MLGFIVIGAGRAGRSFAAALEGRGWRNDGLLGRHDDVSAAATTTDVVLITVPDDAIVSVAAAVSPGPAAVLHASGAEGLGVLGRHQRRGSVHPLMSLPDPVTGAERLVSGIVFAVAGDRAAAAVVDALGGRAVEVDDEARALYHATAAVAANHLVALCAQVERLAAGVGVPVDAYWDLMSSTLGNVRRAGAVSSLTGPAARNDSSTLRLHLATLPEAERELYVTLASEAARLAGHHLDLRASPTMTEDGTGPDPDVSTPDPPPDRPTEDRSPDD